MRKMYFVSAFRSLFLQSKLLQSFAIYSMNLEIFIHVGLFNFNWLKITDKTTLVQLIVDNKRGCINKEREVPPMPINYFVPMIFYPKLSRTFYW